MRPLLLLAILGLLILGIAMCRGSRAALWWGCSIGLLLFHCGSMTYYVGGGFPVSSHSVMAVALLLAPFLGGPMGPFRWLRWNLSDTMLVLMTAGMCVSNYMSGSSPTLMIPRVFCYVIPPYLFGRWYFRSWEDVRDGLKPMLLCLAVLSVFCLFESVTGANILRYVSGGGLWSPDRRAGLVRASGIAQVPIILGLTLMLFMPLAMQGARLARAGTGPTWWRGVPWIMSAALVGTVSRGPVLCALLSYGMFTFFRRPAWRVPIVLVGVVAVLLAVFATDQIKAALMKVSGEEEMLEDHTVYIYVDGEEIIYTGTDHRWILYKVYAEQLRKAGPFGYGDIKVEGVENARDMLDSLRSIDSQHVKVVLNYGFVGMASFLLLTLSPLLNLFKIAMCRHNRWAVLAAGLFGAMVAFQLEIASVALPLPSQMYWLFFTGMCVSVSQLGAVERQWLRTRNHTSRP